MTDRIHSFLVVLAQDMRVDDAEGIAEAVKRIRGVAEVIIGGDNIAGIDHIQAKAQARGELIAKIGKMLEDYV